MIEYRDLFLTDKTVLDHVSAYKADLEKYMATFMLLQNSDVHLDWNVKERVFGTFLIMKNKSAIKFLFSKPFWTILDVRNVIRLLWTKSKDDNDLRLEMRNGRKVKKNRREMLTDIIGNMRSSQIERSILRHSYDAWREVIDFLHISERVFPDYMPIYVADKAHSESTIGGKSPLMKTIMDGTQEPTPFIKLMRSVNQDNIEKKLRGVMVDFGMVEFHYLRSKINFTPEIALAYIEKGDPKNILRWYDELWYPGTMDAICDRILNYQGGMIHLPYSTYFELIYTQRNTMLMSNIGRELYAELLRRADELTTRFHLPIKEPVLIAVDQSSSMSEEQVKIGTVIAAQAAAQLDSDLVYFYGAGYYAGHTNGSKKAEYEDLPQGTIAAIDLIDKHQPIGNTPMAQIMKKYLDAPLSPIGHGIKELQSIVIITDEEENDTWDLMILAQAIEKYREKVGHQIEVLIIRVGSESTHLEETLTASKIPVIRYDIDNLRHIESLFALMSANTPAFIHDQQIIARRLKSVPATTEMYIDQDRNLQAYKKTRDEIFSSVIKGTCTNCSGPLTSEDVTKFRFGGTITCPSCDFSLAPTLFGSHI